MPAPKARSPDEQTSDSQPEQATRRTAIDVLFYTMQCSQRMATWLVIVFAAFMVICLVVDIINGNDLHELLETAKPVFLIGIGGYFGKAAVENVLKIAKDIKSFNTYTGTMTTTKDDSNG